MAMLFTAEEVQQLFHNKFVAILGDSIQRSVYKDLVLLLQKDLYLSNSQLRAKGEFSFEQDFLVEGGRLAELNNGTKYREVRQYRTENHLVRFYFLTRVYSDYLESVLADFEAGPQPDVLIINSCVWDVSRYGLRSMEDYKVNLEKMFTRMDEVLLPDCLLLWNMAMPLARKIKGGFLIPELQHLDKTLRKDIIEGNFYSATFAACHKFDVLDLHYHFRFDGQDRLKDGVHWNQIVHRKITQLLLAHIADAWGVEIPKKKSMEGACWTESIADALEWCFGGNAAPDTDSTMFRIDDRCIRGRPPDCDMFRSDRVTRMERHAWEHPREEYYSNPEPFSDFVFNENSGYCAPQSYSSAPSYQKRQRKEANFANCGPPVSSYNGLEPFFYDDSPALNSSVSSGYTDFEAPNDHCANGPYAGMNKPFANCDFPLYNLGNFTHHTEYPLSERRNEGDNYVMRRPLKSRGSVAPYYRPRNNRYCRY